MAQKRSVYAVIVTYQVEEDFRNNLEAVLPQVEQVVIVDNGSPSTSVAMLERLARQHEGKITLILNPDNVGLAAAQNQGILEALLHEAQFILLLDDDTNIAPNMVQQQVAAYEANPIPERIGLVAPYYEDVNIAEPPRYLSTRGPFWKRRRFEPGQTQMDDVLLAFASGSLIPAEVIQAIGLMREDLFVHFVDTEFNLRMRQKQYKLLVVRSAVMKHRLGNRTEHTFLGRRVTTTNHGPDARYYQCRNRILVAKAYCLTAPGYIAFDFARALLEISRVVMYESGKKEKLQAMFKGYWDGVVGKRGKRH